MAGFSAGLRRGWLPDNRSSHPAARESGRGSPQARLSADGQRAEDRAREGESAVYGVAAGGVAGLRVRVSAGCGGPGHRSGGLPLDLSGSCVGGAGSGVSGVYEEVLPSARGVFEGASPTMTITITA